MTFAPAIGPTIGGYLTENYGWQTIFFVNLLPSVDHGGRACAHARTQPDAARPAEGGRLGRHRPPWRSASSALQTVLEEGNKDDWFGSPFIVGLHRRAFSSTAFILIELRCEAAGEPAAADAAQLRHRRRWPTCWSASRCLARSHTAAILGQVQGYNAEQIGNVLAWTGLPQLILIPFVPLLMKRFDARYIAFPGIAIFAAAAS